MPIAPHQPVRPSAWLFLMVPLMLAAGQAPKGPTPGAQQEASAASVTKASRPETTAQEPPPAPAKQDPSAEPAPETPAEPTLQDSTAEPPPETTGEPRPVAGRQTVAKGSAMRILGRSVKGPGGTVVAQIVNVLVDDSGQPLGAVLDYGGFLGVGKRRIAVAWPMLHFEKTAITLSLTRDQLKDFPEFREGADAVLATAPAAPG